MRKMWSSGKTSCSIAFSSIGRLQVAAERLLHHDPAPLVETDRGQRLGHRREHRRRDGHVEHGDLRLGAGRACRAGRSTSPRRSSRPARGRSACRGGDHRLASASATCSPIASLAWSRKSSSVQSLRATPITGNVQRPRCSQLVEGREQLALGEVAGGAEQHQRVGVGGCDRVGSGRCRWCAFIVSNPFVRGGRRTGAHGGQHLVGHVGSTARREAFVQGGGQHRHRNALVDRRVIVQRPSPESLTTPENSSSWGSAWSASAVRSRSQELTTDSPAPHLGDLREVDVVLVVLRPIRAGRSRRRLAWTSAPMFGLGQHVQ